MSGGPGDTAMVAVRSGWRSGWRSLPFLVAALLSIALMPIGLLAIWQTQTLADTAESQQDLSLIALTELAVGHNTRKMERAVGATSVIAAMVIRTIAHPTDCSNRLRQFIESDPHYIYAGFVTPDGTSACATTHVHDDIKGSTYFTALVRAPKLSVLPDIAVIPGKGAAVTVFNPVVVNGALKGFVVLTVTLAPVAELRLTQDRPFPDTILLINATGDVLHDLIYYGDPDAAKPSAMTTSPDMPTQPQSFHGTTHAGETRRYVAVPVIPNIVFALASFSPRPAVFAPRNLSVPSGVLPVLMWLSSVFVAYFAMHRLVLRHIHALQRQIRSFAAHRQVPVQNLAPNSPNEIADLEQTFANMAFDLADDEAKLEKSLREKNVLLKDVHHRVKNNLQLISSIMNMQIRATKEPEHRFTLRRMQERVLGLATVHRHLYASKNIGKTDTAVLIDALVRHVLRTLEKRPDAITSSLDLDAVTLLPDQAVPLTLLVSEIVTNAINHMQRTGLTDQQLALSVKREGPDHVRLTCGNTRGTARADNIQGADNGISKQLIIAFSTQLGGDIDITETDNWYAVSIVFAVIHRLPDSLDY